MPSRSVLSARRDGHGLSVLDAALELVPADYVDAEFDASSEFHARNLREKASHEST
jgi:hypothetical protein